MRRLLLGLFACLASTLVYAGTQRVTGDQVERLAKATHQKAVDLITADRRAKCMSAFGSSAFCDCLSGSLALAADFQKYITITTAPNDVSVSADEGIAGIVLGVRDRCVASAFQTPK
jgi:hypothetical protein